MRDPKQDPRQSKNKRYKQSRPFGYVRTPFNPMTGKYLQLMPEEDIESSAVGTILQEFKVSAAGLEGIICEDLYSGSRVIVAKPWMFRRSNFQYQTGSGSQWTVEFDQNEPDYDARIFTLPGYYTEYQVITPRYVPNERIVARAIESIEVEMHYGAATEMAVWEDMNVAARCWATMHLADLTDEFLP